MKGDSFGCQVLSALQEMYTGVSGEISDKEGTQMDTKQLLQDIWEARTDFLDEIIQEDCKYKGILDEQEKKWKEVKTLNLSNEDLLKVMEYADMKSAVGERYSNLAYALGFADGLSLGKM